MVASFGDVGRIEVVVDQLLGTILSTRADEHNNPSDEAEMIYIKSLDKMKISVKEIIDPIPSIYQKNMVEISTQANRDIVAASDLSINQVCIV